MYTCSNFHCIMAVYKCTCTKSRLYTFSYGRTPGAIFKNSISISSPIRRLSFPTSLDVTMATERRSLVERTLGLRRRRDHLYCLFSPCSVRVPPERECVYIIEYCLYDLYIMCLSHYNVLWRQTVVPLLILWTPRLIWLG